jgi:hypothetical protein
LVEGEKDRTEVGFGPFGRIRLEVRLDVDDEGGADCGEQTGLRTRSALSSDKRNTEAHKDQGCVEILVVLLHILGIVFHRLPFVHGVEIELGVVGLDRLEVHP